MHTVVWMKFPRGPQNNVIITSWSLKGLAVDWLWFGKNQTSRLSNRKHTARVNLARHKISYCIFALLSRGFWCSSFAFDGVGRSFVSRREKQVFKIPNLLLSFPVDRFCIWNWINVWQRFDDGVMLVALMTESPAHVLAKSKIRICFKQFHKF